MQYYHQMLQSRFNTAFTKSQTYRKVNLKNESLDGNNILHSIKLKEQKLN